MTDVMGIARFRFLEGKAEEFKRLAQQAKEIVKAKDPGTLQYDVYLNADETECIVLERYTDSQALIDHFENMTPLLGPILACVTVVHGEVLGEPSDELRARLAGTDVPTLFTPYLSMEGTR